MFTSRRRSCVNSDTRKVRSSTQRRRNMRLHSSARLIRKLWTCKVCQKSKLFLSFRAISTLCFLPGMEFVLTHCCSKFLKKNLIIYPLKNTQIILYLLPLRF
uniref:Uncharacterized protein n=2 Tax=Felinae TaxID=338152 RepID=A0ABI7XMN8_FELCA